MRTISIRDRDDRNVLTFDLVDILRALGQDARTAVWSVDVIECVGDGADELYGASASGRRLPGEQLLVLASRTDQVVDGTFTAFRQDGDSKPWLVVRAVDSDAYDVSSRDDAALARLRAAFQDVEDVD